MTEINSQASNKPHHSPYLHTTFTHMYKIQVNKVITAVNSDSPSNPS